MSGLIGKKIGMTSIFDENGKNIPCTVLEVGPCVVTQVRTKAIDGYDALQLGFDDKEEKRATNAALGHFKKANTTPKKKLIEFQNFDQEYKLGDTITVEHFKEGEFVVRKLQRKRIPRCCKASRIRRSWSGNTWPAQPSKSSWINWCCFLPCSSF